MEWVPKSKEEVMYVFKSVNMTLMINTLEFHCHVSY